MMRRMTAFLMAALVWVARGAAARAETGAIFTLALLEEDFRAYAPGVFFSVVGAHAEYHYLPETAPKGPWGVTAYRSDSGSQRAWRVLTHEGRRVMAQTFTNRRRETHPMLAAGDPLWGDYELAVEFAPERAKGRSGVCVRCRNDRCYYFFGVDGQTARLIRVRHATAIRTPAETVLAQAPCGWAPGEYVTARVRVEGSRIRAELGRDVLLEAQDGAFDRGGIALLADIPTRFAGVVVRVTDREQAALAERLERRVAEETRLQAENPEPVVWRRLETDGFGVGRNLRFGDLDRDGRPDLLIGQVRHHGPKDRNSEVSCLTALTLEGKQLWQIGEPDPWKDHLTNDVAFQIHDLDGDGASEVIYCMNQEIVVADGASGAPKHAAPTPETAANTAPPYDRFPRILGDSLFFCDVRGVGRDSDIVLKDRYRSFWVLDDRLGLLWHAQCNTGHYPFAEDIDGDGRDEIAMGYSLFDHDGALLWSLDDALGDHADGTAIVRFRPETGEAPRIFCAASDEGAILLDLRGNVLKHHFLGHVQNPAIADFRPDLPGLEVVTVNFWGNQGIIHFFDAAGDVYHDFEPFHHGSMCLPVNWTGEPGEYVVLSANAVDGGMFDGSGRRVVRFPDDGHPDMCYAVLDLTGDCRDEVVVWDPYELWVYTQGGAAPDGPLYRPVRNPLYNSSNYQATVSLPGWER